MLNPGSASLSDLNLRENEFIEGGLRIDPTMRSLESIVKELNSNEPLEGRLYIYNLFPLQHTNAKEAKKLFEQLWEDNEPLVKSFPIEKAVLQQQLKQTPWVLLGWGVGRNSSNLKRVITEWKNLIHETGTPILSISNDDHYSYYHPNPLLVSKKIEFRKKLKNNTIVYQCDSYEYVIEIYE